MSKVLKIASKRCELSIKYNSWISNRLICFKIVIRHSPIRCWLFSHYHYTEFGEVPVFPVRNQHSYTCYRSCISQKIAPRYVKGNDVLKKLLQLNNTWTPIWAVALLMLCMISIYLPVFGGTSARLANFPFTYRR